MARRALITPGMVRDAQARNLFVNLTLGDKELCYHINRITGMPWWFVDDLIHTGALSVDTPTTEHEGD